jgi:hypothetical protein
MANSSHGKRDKERKKTKNPQKAAQNASKAARTPRKKNQKGLAPSTTVQHSGSTLAHQSTRTTRLRLKLKPPAQPALITTPVLSDSTLPIDSDATSCITPPPDITITPQQITNTVAEIVGWPAARAFHKDAYPDMDLPPEAEIADIPSPSALLDAIEPSHADTEPADDDDDDDDNDSDDGNNYVDNSDSSSTDSDEMDEDIDDVPPVQSKGQTAGQKKAKGTKPLKCRRSIFLFGAFLIMFP